MQSGVGMGEAPEQLAAQLFRFREALTRDEQRVFDVILSLGVGADDDLTLHGSALSGPAIARLAHAVGVSAVALSIALTVGVTPAGAAPVATAMATGQSAPVGSVAPAPAVDLVITSATLGPMVNGFSELELTIANRGAADANSFHIAVHGGSTRLAEWARGSGLKAGFKYTETHRVSVGTHKEVVVMVDSRNEVGNYGADNNTRFLVVERGRADLAIADGQAAVVHNNRTTFTYSVRNAGEIRAYAFNIAVIDEKGTVLERRRHQAPVDPGEAYTGQISNVHVGAAQRVRIVIDSSEEVIEWRDNNNSVWITLSR